MTRQSLIAGIAALLLLAATACRDDIIHENAVDADVRITVTDPGGVPVPGATVMIEVFEPDVASDPGLWTGDTRTTDAVGQVTFGFSVFLAPPCDCPSTVRATAPPASGLADALVTTTIRLDDPKPPLQVIEVTLQEE